VLWRLNELGVLARLRRISSVSGGSITAALLGLRWSALGFTPDGVATQFVDQVVRPIRRMAGTTVDWKAVAKGILTPATIAESVADAYKNHLYGKATLQSLPDERLGAPRFVLNAANVQSGALWRFSRPYMGDYKVGRVLAPQLPLSLAVAASSAFPPFLSPLEIKLERTQYAAPQHEELHKPPYTTRPVLSDGGVYDNLGLETAWKRYRTVYVSDAGGRMTTEPNPKRDWLLHARRVLDLVDNQVRSLRKRQVIAAYKLPKDGGTLWRRGAYWGIWSDIADYHASAALACPHSATLRLAAEPTRLASLPARTQERLINWGYAVADAALRTVGEMGSATPPREFPYPASGV
jgi:NTE family protein